MIRQSTMMCGIKENAGRAGAGSLKLEWMLWRLTCYGPSFLEN